MPAIKYIAKQTTIITDAIAVIHPRISTSSIKLSFQKFSPNFPPGNFSDYKYTLLSGSLRTEILKRKRESHCGLPVV